MEEDERVAGAEPERALRPLPRLAATSRARERPCERVVSQDRRPRRTGSACACHERRRPDPVVRVEDHGLDIGAHPVRGEDPVDRADGRDLLPSGAAVSRAIVEIGEQGDELRQGNGGGSARA